MTSKAPSGRRGRTSRLSPWTSRSSASADPGRKLGGCEDLHAHDVMDTPGCGRVGSVVGSTVHTRRRLAAMVLLTLLGAALIVALDRQRRPGSARRARWAPASSAAWPRRSRSTTCPAQRAAYERDAALGLSHVLYAKSPGGVVASARRTAHWRPIVDRVATRPQARRRHARGDRHARDRPGAPTRARPTTCAPPSGLTQILAETGQNLLGLHIDVKASERLTPRHPARPPRRGAREAARRRVDERFDPAKAIEATARYLDFAKGKLGRDDLAVVSYHMGVGNLQQALVAYGKGVVPYAQLYFDSSAAAPRARRGASSPRSATTPRPTSGACSRRARSCACTATTRAALERRGGAAVPQGLGRGGPAPGRAHAGLRRPVRDRPRAGVGRAARRSTATVLAPYGLQHRPEHGRARAGASSSRRACTARCARRRSRCSRRSARRRRAISRQPSR